MSQSHIKLVLGPSAGDALVEIEGVNVTNAIRHISIEAGVFERHVTIALAMAKVEHDGIQLLARFGWLPPDGAHMNPDGSVVLERLVDPTDPRGEKP